MLYNHLQRVLLTQDWHSLTPLHPPNKDENQGEHFWPCTGLSEAALGQTSLGIFFPSLGGKKVIIMNKEPSVEEREVFSLKKKIVPSQFLKIKVKMHGPLCTQSMTFPQDK